MAMTNQTMAPPVAPNTVASRSNAGKEDPLAGVKEEFDAQVKAESAPAPKVENLINKPIRELTEDDAYNLEIAMSVSKNVSPYFLKVVLKDPNMTCRWGNTNAIRQGQLVAKGFKPVLKEDVANLEDLEMHLDNQDHFVWADLIAVKISKEVYYAGLRAAFVKSLHATSNKKASERGANFATKKLTSQLLPNERAYMEQHDGKPVYNPQVGV